MGARKKMRQGQLDANKMIQLCEKSCFCQNFKLFRVVVIVVENLARFQGKVH
jgi:hypothetical protein